jgi:hypothetical protein
MTIEKGRKIKVILLMEGEIAPPMARLNLTLVFLFFNTRLNIFVDYIKLK